MKKQKTIGPRIRYARERFLGLSQPEFAKVIGMSQGALSKIESGAGNPRDLEPFIKALKVSRAWLAFGEGEAKPRSLGAPKSGTSHVPVISWEQISKWNEVKMQLLDLERAKTLHVDPKLAPGCFALEVRDDSMTSIFNPSLPRGTYIVIDTLRKQRLNDIVIAALRGEEMAICRQLIKDGKKLYLRPLNAQFEKIPFDETIEIVGVVIKYEGLLTNDFDEIEEDSN